MNMTIQVMFMILYEIVVTPTIDLNSTKQVIFQSQNYKHKIYLLLEKTSQELDFTIEGQSLASQK